MYHIIYLWKKEEDYIFYFCWILLKRLAICWKIP